MIKIYESHDRIFVESIKATLLSEGIEHLVKDESSSSLGEVPSIVSCQHVWVIQEDDLERARALVKQLESQADRTHDEPWVCAQCNEQLEAQFTTCWNCGSERPVEA